MGRDGARMRIRRQEATSDLIREGRGDGRTSDPMSRGRCAAMLLRVVCESVCAQDTIVEIEEVGKNRENLYKILLTFMYTGRGAAFKQLSQREKQKQQGKQQ